VGISAIAEALGLDRKTVRRYAHAASPEDLPAGTGKRENRVQPYLGYPHQRWNEGCTDAVPLCGEIRGLGYRGSERTVRRHPQTLRASGQPAPTVTQELTVRQATRLLTSHPDHLDENGTLRLKELLARCPELDSVATCVRTFAEMMTERKGDDLADWLGRAEATGFPSLASLARGLRQDFDAVTAGLTMEWNSGRVEGNVNRVILWNASASQSIECEFGGNPRRSPQCQSFRCVGFGFHRTYKRIKRDGYGRAGFDLHRPADPPRGLNAVTLSDGSTASGPEPFSVSAHIRATAFAVMLRRLATAVTKLATWTQHGSPHPLRRRDLGQTLDITVSLGIADTRREGFGGRAAGPGRHRRTRGIGLGAPTRCSAARRCGRPPGCCSSALPMA
jgi:hypothetical protein